MSAKAKAKPKGSERARKIEFNFSDPHARGVYIAGDFNQWNTFSHPLKQDKSGNWRISLTLNPGQYEYRFFVDGRWQNDPSCSSFVENPFGTSNCLKIVD